MNELSIINLILEAGLIVKLVLGLLLIASFWSWTIIFLKLKSFKQHKQELTAFKDRFYSTVDLSKLYKNLEKSATSDMELIFVAGFREYVRLNKNDLERKEILNGTGRAMKIIVSRKLEHIEHSLPFLATVGSTSPYIGLFGTVWGIMNSFNALSLSNSASIAMVAPGISEALIATAMGLFAAIPGVIFYNRFVTETNLLLNKYDTFQEEFITILQRQ